MLFAYFFLQSILLAHIIETKSHMLLNHGNYLSSPPMRIETDGIITKNNETDALKLWKENYTDELNKVTCTREERLSASSPCTRKDTRPYRDRGTNHSKQKSLLFFHLERPDVSSTGFLHKNPIVLRPRRLPKKKKITRGAIEIRRNESRWF